MTTAIQPSFDRTAEEDDIIQKIAARASAFAEKYEGEYDPTDAAMDVTACHANGCKLRLQELLDADDFNFAHDVFGIRAHIDRSTGKMPPRKFHPRFSVPHNQSQEEAKPNFNPQSEIQNPK